MKSNQIRKQFLDYFESKQHQIVPSAPMVLKDDPTLMFTNAGMNQFKDLFLGNSPIVYKRIADSQKCLRVSGKHNDLEEVGHDTYHHTMFEMLGNWSFGDYFKKDAIDWAWELLVDIYKIPQDKIYVTIFQGSPEEGVERDDEAAGYWKKYLSDDRILAFSKKDNFWEMGDTGPCGPCSEIHVDLRSDEERKKIDGASLVNIGDPQVIEIWNLVFIQYNRKANGELELLPAKHVDTGMGFERLCRVIQKKTSNYDSDVFQPIIQAIANLSRKEYGKNETIDIAMRVIADHIRTICFAIADGQLPSNNKAGYVIRRILRRAVRYGYSYLDLNQPFMAQLLPALQQTMADSYPELIAQQSIIEKVLTQEEETFLRTLETGIKRLDAIMATSKRAKSEVISGVEAFELYDTYGFPLDLTELILREHQLTVNKTEFDEQMQIQKERSRNAAVVDTDDWVVIKDLREVEFVGYDSLECEAQISKYRKVTQKGKDSYQIVLNRTPFYAESGGQAGDQGVLIAGNDIIHIIETKKENNLPIHLTDQLPSNLTKTFIAKVDVQKRIATANNHSATHLLQAALRQVLGSHIEQKGSSVNESSLRFDFSHFAKVSDEELKIVERIVNQKIRQNIALEEYRNIPIQEAKDMGATALFGEKYGDSVRAIAFDKNYSIELCGGTHVSATGQIGLFKILSESAVAAGIRRIEAITALKAEDFVEEELKTLQEVKQLLKVPKHIVKSVEKLIEENVTLQKQIENFEREKLAVVKEQLAKKAKVINGINVIAEKVIVDSPAMFKDLSFLLRDMVDNLFLVLGAEINGKANVSVMISQNLITDKNLSAVNFIREISKEIQGGGGGQAFYATAGGKDLSGIDKAIAKAVTLIQ